MAEAGEDKTEKPTAQKKAKARREGQIARTPELGSWLSLLAVGLALGPMVRHELTALQELIHSSLEAISNPTADKALLLLRQGATHAFLTILTLASIVLLVGIIAATAQGGFVVAPKRLQPKLDKLNLLKGFKNLFSVQTLWQGAKMLVKSAVVGFVAWRAIVGIMPLVGGLVPMDAVLSEVHHRAFSLIRTIAIIGLLFAGADYAFTKRKHDKQLKMTKSEIKQEHKQSEGDPLVKSAIRAKQRQMSRTRMIADVADADVLLVNPTHIAIALKYSAERGAPRVVARGAGAIATKIRLEAAKNRVPLVQDVPLARALYRSCQVGQEIPQELWAAVAQVLAFVITRRNQGHYGGEHRSPRPDRDQPLPDVLPAGRRRPPPKPGPTHDHLA
jgi:flagellar biosynthesis protein FlhB